MCRLAAGQTLSRWAATIEKSPTGYVSRDLYLGLSGRVYWYCVDATSGGGYANSLLDLLKI